jgi:hypothetical protein
MFTRRGFLLDKAKISIGGGFRASQLEAAAHLARKPVNPLQVQTGLRHFPWGGACAELKTVSINSNASA